MTERLDAVATSARLPYATLVDALAEATAQMAAGRIVCPPRSVVPMGDGTLLLSMPAVCADLAIHKLITVAPGNARRGLPVILGTVTALDPVSGEVLLVMDGPTVTGRRTAAMSVLATTVLRPRRGPRATTNVLLIGTGAQAGHHVDALSAVFPQSTVHVRGTSTRSVSEFCSRFSGAAVAVRPDDGGVEPDVVIACTTSRTPVYRAPADAARLVVATGAFEPDAAEIDPATVRGSDVFVDDPVGARHEAGDLLQAGIDWSAVKPLAAAVAPYFRLPSRPVLFKSVGCAAWDLAAARVGLATGSIGR